MNLNLKGNWNKKNNNKKTTDHAKRVEMKRFEGGVGFQEGFNSGFTGRG